MPELTVLILAGGASSRMGADKAWLDVAGRPLVEHVARRLLPLAGEVLFSARPDPRFDAVAARLLPLLQLPARVIADEHVGAGPLAGLHAGLAAATYPLVFAVATDMPFVNLALVGHMLDRAGGCDAVLPLTAAPGSEAPQPEPLHALYRVACLPAIEAALAAQRRRLVSFLSDVAACYLNPAEIAVLDPEGLSFSNVNTPAEWEAAGRRLRGGSAP